MKTLAEAGAVLLGGKLSRSEALGGGSLSQIVRIVLSDGREAIVKNGPSPKTEAAMLQAIAASGVPAPAVLGVSDEALVIACLPSDGSLTRGWASLGAHSLCCTGQKASAMVGRKTMLLRRFRSKTAGAITGRAFGRSGACWCMSPIFRRRWRTASKRSPPILPTVCRHARRRLCFMAICGAATCWSREVRLAG